MIGSLILGGGPFLKPCPPDASLHCFENWHRRIFSRVQRPKSQLQVSRYNFIVWGVTPWSAKKAAYEQRSCSDNGNGEFVVQNLLETVYDHLIRLLCGRAKPTW